MNYCNLEKKIRRVLVKEYSFTSRLVTHFLPVSCLAVINSPMASSTHDIFILSAHHADVELWVVGSTVCGFRVAEPGKKIDEGGRGGGGRTDTTFF